MNCADIDRILDEHRASELTAARRADLDAHLAECRRCAAAWLTDDALAREPVPAPRPELLAATLRAVRKRAAPEQWSGRDWWRAAAGLAAVAVVSLLAATMPFRLASDSTPAARQAALVAGRDYRVLGAPRPAAQARREPIEVLAFFAYDCPVCYSLEARMLEWRAGQSSRIAFVRMPVQWNARGLRFARAFYAADALGKSRELHATLFDELRERPGSLDDDAAIAALFARFGVDAQTLQRALESPSVVAAAERARRIGAEAGVLSVPTLVIGGEVATTQAAAATPDRLFEIASLLVECVEQRRRTPRANESAQHC